MGDWIIYLEPTKVSGTRGYFAVAKVQKVVPDLIKPRMYFALIEPGTYLPFSHQVDFRGLDGVIESGVLNAEGRISGRAQAAVRSLSAVNFNEIIDRGFKTDSTLPPRIDGSISGHGLSEIQAPFEFEADRDRIQFLTSRITRDRVFRQVILRAYDSRCAITGLRLINGGGRAEVEAAHIRPVAAGGPDSADNGLALSGTAHWMFDRGLLGIEDDFRILISRHVNDTDSVRAMINSTGYIPRIQRAADRPHPRFLCWHRDNCYKG